VTHRVVHGETLSGIAATYGVTLAALEKANRITTPNLIIAGQVLIIPTH
jgi:LysM repeat protein